MKEIIAEVMEELKSELEKMFAEGPNLEGVENFTFSAMKRKAVKLTEAYAEAVNEEIHADKAGRKRAGLIIERRNDKRSILSRIGEINYRRDYYRLKDGTYCYPVDQVLEIEKRQRVSDQTILHLAEEALKTAYAESSRIVTDSQVSRQTVMKAVRACEAVPKEEEKKLREVSVLHIDADEDHVNLQSGGNQIVPLVSVYEGFEKDGTGEGKRRRCRNIFHYSEARFHEDFWDNVLIEIRKRYGLKDTKVYLHGDGAAWIKEGTEHFKNCVFVLDSYHRNKAEKGFFAGLEVSEGESERRQLRQALQEGDHRLLKEVYIKRLEQSPDHVKSITEAKEYLDHNLKGIAIRYKDTEAMNGGASEPHVSHVLSSRLSSRPMGWSKTTLNRLVPMLATKKVQLHKDPKDYNGSQKPILSAAKAVLKIKTVSERRLPALVDPDRCTMSVVLTSGKLTQLYRVINKMSR